MNYTNSILGKEKIELNYIQVLEDTNKVSAFYSTNKISAWKYENENWKENYFLLAEQLGITTSDICTTFQTHTNVVRVMKKENGGEGVLFPTKIQDYDAVITNEKNLLLCSFEADCVPVYFFDKKNNAIGLAHSGWKGTAKEICKETIFAMQNEYGSKAEDFIVVIGPCACKKCYEVGSDLIEKFKNNFGENISSIFIPKSKEKFNLDLKKAIEITLTKCGVKSDNIYDVNRCTIESNELCSFRRTKSTTCHMLTAIMLK